MLYISEGGADRSIGKEELKRLLEEAFAKLGTRQKILILPPDHTRFHSRAGEIAELAWNYFGEAVSAVMPALGTHYPMKSDELKAMFGSIPEELFIDHNWRNDVETLGEIPGAFIAEITDGKLDYSWPVQVNRLLLEGEFDLVLSVGQVVPHEVIGMANYTKNILVGTGGSETINKSHFIGAVCNMETILGRTDNPVRTAVDTGFDTFLSHLPVLFIQTVIGVDEEGIPHLRGIYMGDDRSCFEKAADLAAAVNITMLEEAPNRVVTFLDPEEFKSTWLGNKSIYRSRLAIADGGELIVIAPGVSSFGEDPEIDRLIRAYGYRGSAEVLKQVAEHEELQENLSAAAHLIHGSSEGRFKVTYAPGGLTKEEIERVGYEYGVLEKVTARFSPEGKVDGWYEDSEGEPYYFIANPALGLWTTKERFKL